MNSYLNTAFAVLSRASVPMSAREILEAAYRLQAVPDHLFGKTQHKTLHARLSEDILRNRDTSLFARTAPGRFHLRSELSRTSDRSASYVAPQRSNQLKQFQVVCADATELQSLSEGQPGPVRFGRVAHAFKRQEPLRRAERNPDLVCLRLFVTIGDGERVLTFSALGGPDSVGGRCLGIEGYVKADDADLFSPEPFGVEAAARRTLEEQSVNPGRTDSDLEPRHSADELICVRVAGQGGGWGAFLLTYAFACRDPERVVRSFPATRSPRWTRVPAEINDLSGLEPLSRGLLTACGGSIPS